MTRRTLFLWMGLTVLFSLPLLPAQVFGTTYQVRPGDTVAAIAKRHGVSTEALAKANQLQNHRIKTKQILTIPTPEGVRTAGAEKAARAAKTAPPAAKTTYRVAKGDTLSGIAARTGLSVAQLREFNALKGNALRIGQTLRLERKGSPRPAAEKADVALLKVHPDLEEEEGDGAADHAEAWREIERRKQENAVLLGRWNSPEEPKLLVKVATGFLGAPYRLGGSSVTGLDCSAFVKKIYDIFNINLPRTAFEQARIGLPVSRGELVEGDLIFFNTRRAFGHVGIYIGNNEFVHASSRKRGVRVDSLDTPYFDKRFVRAVRLKGLDEGT